MTVPNQPNSPKPDRTQTYMAAQTSPFTDVRLNGQRFIRRLFIACVVIEILFVLLDCFVNYSRWTEIGPIRRMFNITREDGMASWFGITQTMLVGLTALFIWFIRRHQPVSRYTKIGWFILAAALIYMAVDDGSTIHERLGSTLKELRRRSGGTSSSSWFPSYDWQIIFLPFFAALGLFMLVFLWRELNDRFLRWCVAVTIGCFMLAVGLDFIEGLDEDHRLNLYSAVAERWDFSQFARKQFRATPFEALRHFSKSLEETLEMFGMTVLWLTFLTHWTRIAPEVRLRVTHQPATPAQ